MPTTITSAGITFNDTTSLTSAVIPANAVGATQIADGAVTNPKLANGAVTAAKLGTTEQTRIAKAWVNFDGTTSPGTIRSSYNVSSVTKNAAGDYTVNFATAMADANYSAFVTTGSSATINVKGSDGPRTTSNIQIFSRDVVTDSQSDPSFVNVSIFGN